MLDESDEPIEGKHVLGFLMSFGCTADDQEEAERRVTDYVVDNSEGLWSFNLLMDNVEVLSEDDLQETVYADEDIAGALLHDPREWGLWYVSSRAFYHDDEEDEGAYEAEIVPGS